MNYIVYKIIYNIYYTINKQIQISKRLNVDLAVYTTADLGAQLLICEFFYISCSCELRAAIRRKHSTRCQKQSHILNC